MTDEAELTLFPESMVSWRNSLWLLKYLTMRSGWINRKSSSSALPGKANHILRRRLRSDTAAKMIDGKNVMAIQAKSTPERLGLSLVNVPGILLLRRMVTV
jgi:hypothetical protein